MKKILYSLMAIGGLFATSCASFDEPVTEVYPDGPAVAIEVSETSDNAFTFTVTPAEGTMYYSVLVAEGDEAASLDAETLYKCGYKADYGTVLVDAAKNATFTYDMLDAEGKAIAKPNTTYQIYAVAANKYGVIGEIAVAAVTTTDNSLPGVTDYEYDAENKAQFVAFSENVYRGEGAVKVQYYKYMELATGVLNPIDVPADEIVVQIQANQAAIVAPTTPAGAYVAISWEEGAFVDGFGNKIKAVNSGFSTAQNNFVGLYGQNETESFAIAAENITAPETGSVVESWEDFMGEITFDFDIYQAAKTGLSVTYTNAKSTKTITLGSSEWMAQGKAIYFVLPEEPAAGDIITVSVAAGVVVDVYGNPNEAYEGTEVWWKMFDFTATEDMVLGSFQAVGVSSYDGVAYSLGNNVTIATLPSYDSQVPAGKACIIQNLCNEGTAILGYYDLDNAKVYVGSTYDLGFVQAADGTVYGSVTYSQSGANWIEFTINKDGTLTSTDFAWVVCDTEYTSLLGWWDKFSMTTLTKNTAAAAVSSAKSVVTKAAGLKGKPVKSIKK